MLAGFQVIQYNFSNDSNISYGIPGVMSDKNELMNQQTVRIICGSYNSTLDISKKVSICACVCVCVFFNTSDNTNTLTE